MAIPGVSIFDSNGNLITSVAGSLQVVVTGTTGSGVTATQSTTNTAVPSNAANVTVKASAGRLFSVTVTTVGTVGLTITDGTGGTVIFVLTAAQAAALGTYNAPTGGIPFNTSLVVVGAATNPSVTISYA
jgi:hypothetical protein